MQDCRMSLVSAKKTRILKGCEKGVLRTELSKNQLIKQKNAENSAFNILYIARNSD